MRLHRNLVYTTIDALNAIFNEGEYIKSLPDPKKINAGEDGKFVAETIYEIVRWKDYTAEIAYEKNLLTEIIFENVFCLGVLRGYPIPDWR
jgi:16S rRNA (cytosine967-C5)-methyltransferase